MYKPKTATIQGQEGIHLPEYSQNFKDFLSTKPGERWEFLKAKGLVKK